MARQPYVKSNIKFAKDLRERMTPEEKRLWFQFLRRYPVHIYRQRPIDRYIVDFYCYKAKLVIEVDGNQHYSPYGLAKDAERTKVLNSYGVHVMRFRNHEVRENFAGVCAKIDAYIKNVLKRK